MNSLFDTIVTKDHLVRKMNNTLDFSFIADDFRAVDKAPDISPVFIAKYLLLIYLYRLDRGTRMNITLPEQIDDQMSDNMAYRLFLGFDIGVRIPGYNEVMQAKETLGSQEKWDTVLNRLLQQCKKNGLPYKQGGAFDD